MTARVLRPAITFTTVTAVLLAALAVYAFLSAGTSSADSTYTPATGARFCNALVPFSDLTLQGTAGACDEYSEENRTTSAAANYTTTLVLDAPELNFSNVTTFAPVGTTITDGQDVPEGAKVGGLRSLTTLGFANAACLSPLTIDFIFYNVDLPDNMADPRASGNIMFPRVEGSPDRFGGWGNPAPGAGLGTSPGTGDATGTSVAIVNYPSYLLDLFDPDFIPGVGDNADGGANSVPIVPQAVYGGLHNVSGTWVPLYFAQFNPTGVRSLAGLPSPLSLMDPDMGAPSLSVLNDPTAVQASPSSITDFCTNLAVTTMLLGTTTGGTGGSNPVRATNPGTAGTAYVMQYNASIRDTEQDGWENSLDACPLNVDAGDPRVTGAGDADSDGIPDSCDPNDATGVLHPQYNDGGGDEVGGFDGFQNRQDNCPLINNPTQNDAELAEGASPDNGPHTDAIGDPCDTGTVSVQQNECRVPPLTGTPAIAPCSTTALPSFTITMADDVNNGRYHVVTNHIAKCFGNPPADIDSDGYCSAQDNVEPVNANCETPPSPPNPPSPYQNCTVRHTVWTGTSPAAATHPMLQADSDGDGVVANHKWSDAYESYMHTDATHSCAQTTVANDEQEDNWPADFNDDGLVNNTDIIRVNPHVGKGVNAPAPNAAQGGGTVYPTLQRMDLFPDGLINNQDTVRFNAVFGKRCGPTTPTTPPIPAWSQQ